MSVKPGDRWPNGRFIRVCERCGGHGYVAYFDDPCCPRCDCSGIDPDDRSLGGTPTAIAELILANHRREERQAVTS